MAAMGAPNSEKIKVKEGLTGRGPGWQAKIGACPSPQPPHTHTPIPTHQPPTLHPRSARTTHHAPQAQPGATTLSTQRTGDRSVARGAAHTHTRHPPPQTTDTTTAHRVAKDRTARAAKQRATRHTSCEMRPPASSQLRSRWAGAKRHCACIVPHRAHTEPPQVAHGTVGLTYGRQRQAGRGSGRQRAHLLISFECRSAAEKKHRVQAQEAPLNSTL
jgi:hypothetical protein